MSAKLHDELQQRARRDDPARALVWADEEAWVEAEGHGSAAAAEAIRRKDAEAWIPGLPARKTVMSMGWVIVFVVFTGGALSWVPDYAWVEPVATSLKVIAALAVLAAAWSILSEMRGWEGSDASRWLLKRRIKTYQKAFDARRQELRDTLIAIGTDTVTVYLIEDGRLLANAYGKSSIEEIAVEPTGRHMTLRLRTASKTWRFEWLPRNPAVEAAIARLANG